MIKKLLISMIFYSSSLMSPQTQDMAGYRCWDFNPALDNYFVEDGEYKWWNMPSVDSDCASKDGKNIVKSSYGYYYIVNENNNPTDGKKLQLLLGYDNGFVGTDSKDKRGVYDNNLKQIIPFKYDHIVPYKSYRYQNEEVFNNDFGWYVFIDYKWGFIDQNGKVLIKPKYKRIHIINDTTFIAYHKEKLILINSRTKKKSNLGKICFRIDKNFNPCIYTKMEDKIGLMNFNGKELFLPIFSEIKILTDEEEYLKENICFYKVKLNGKFGLIDSKGNWVLDAQYDYINTLRYYDRSIRERHLFFVLESDSTSEVFYKNKILNIDGDSYKEFDGTGMIQFEKKGLFGLFDFNKEEIVIPPIYQGFINIPLLKSIKIKKDGYYGLIDLKGRVMIPTVYKMLKGFRSERKLLKFSNNSDGKIGIISSENQILISDKYNYLSVYNDTVYLAKKHRKYGVISNTEKMILDFEFDNIFKFYRSNDELLIAKVENNGKFGLINKNYKLHVDIKYHKIVGFREGLSVVMADYKWGYINKEGKEIIPLKYDTANSFYSGKAQVSLNGKTYFIDTNGNCVQDCP